MPTPSMGMLMAAVGRRLRGLLAHDKSDIINAIVRWAASPTASFVDVYLAVLAERDNLPVCSANARDFLATPNRYASAML